MRLLNTLWSNGTSVHSSVSAKAQKDIDEWNAIQPLPYVDAGHRVPMSSLISKDDDGDTPDDDLISHDVEYAQGQALSHSDEYLQIPLGKNMSARYSREARQLLHEHRSQISSTLSKEPARVTPMRLEVDKAEWMTKSNQLPTRIQSPIKDAEIRRKIEIMLENGVVIDSDSAEWSQVLLTPKPGQKWRFCIDFRKLNSATKSQGYPLPRIKEIITRIGQHKPRFFAKLDLTNGYHQMPLAKESQPCTAFTSNRGIFQWTRVPMGLKNAAAYFQKVMAEEVLAGLVQHICELYIDDCIIYADSEKELLKRIRTILQRCRDFNIIINPEKCVIGETEIEILGHVINQEGIKFSKERLALVADIPLPTTGTKLLSFLGVINYLRTTSKTTLV